MMKKIDAPALHKMIETFALERDWDQFHSVKNLSMALSVESSELLEIFQWMKEEDSNQVTDPKTLGKIEDELADILYYLLRLSGKTGIDLEDALLKKMKKNEAKYPVELAKGNSKKYNEF